MFSFSWMSSAVPMTPSGPGSIVARVSTMKWVGSKCHRRRYERIVRLERNEDRAVAALGHEIKAMIEELAEEGEPGIERSGQPGVRRDVREVEHVLVVGSAEQAVQARALDDLNAILEHVVIGRASHAEVQMTVHVRGRTPWHRQPDCWRSGRRSGWRWCEAASRRRFRWSACMRSEGRRTAGPKTCRHLPRCGTAGAAGEGTCCPQRRTRSDRNRRR